MKKIIINADDFGYSKENNEAIKSGFETGIITSTSIMANMDGFEHAINEILPQIPDIDKGFHFNIIEGKSITNPKMLCNNEGYFNNGYKDLIIKSKQKEFLKQAEAEFRAQIEKILSHTEISHIDSHVHTHAIPEIFKLTLKLAEEYKIKYIRTQYEKPYIVAKKVLNTKFPINIIKNVLLNTFTLVNKNSLKNSEVKTNDYFIGVLYTGYMDEDAILNGIKKIREENSVTEIIFHPYLAQDLTLPGKSHNYREYLITQNPNFKKALENSDFVLTNYKN